MTCPPSTGLFAGMTILQLQAALSAAQQAYIDLAAGKTGVSFSYGQGDGQKAVTYRPTTPAEVTVLIRQLQAALGLPGVGRRPLRMLYR